jgi:hypothetical protein
VVPVEGEGETARREFRGRSWVVESSGEKGKMRRKSSGGMAGANGEASRSPHVREAMSWRAT